MVDRELGHVSRLYAHACHGYAATETERIGADRSGGSLGCRRFGPRDHDQLIAGGSFHIVRCMYKDMPDGGRIKER